jgi:hypothetical protein
MALLGQDIALKTLLGASEEGTTLCFYYWIMQLIKFYQLLMTFVCG